ncbi:MULTISPECIES: hypothetical protein [Streptomyces]|uniref:hypothetical protein n=1 Tax=Streptomyces TaxID=1883 RepID=UPI00142E3238|nr:MULTISPECIES: hypothetical protein [Streptomyces]
MPIVRTTIQPHLEVEVSDAEYTDLKRQGLLIEDAPAAAPAAAPAKTTAAAKSKE